MKTVKVMRRGSDPRNLQWFYIGGDDPLCVSLWEEAREALGITDEDREIDLVRLAPGEHVVSGEAVEVEVLPHPAGDPGMCYVGRATAGWVSMTLHGLMMFLPSGATGRYRGVWERLPDPAEEVVRVRPVLVPGSKDSLQSSFYVCPSCWSSGVSAKGCADCEEEFGEPLLIADLLARPKPVEEEKPVTWPVVLVGAGVRYCSHCGRWPGKIGIDRCVSCGSPLSGEMTQGHAADALRAYLDKEAGNG